MAGPSVAGPSAGVYSDRFNHSYWHRLNTEQLGVAAIDPLGHEIGIATVPRLGGSWNPVDGKKHILVGRVDRYGWYNPDIFTLAPDEADFNIFIEPTRPFRYILDRIVDAASQDDLDDFQPLADGSGYAVECEITPDEEYYDNRWFPNSNDRPSPMIGRTIGLYGPWVQDMGPAHNGRPEIHPSECIWWRNRSVSAIARFDESAAFRCIVLQDDSNRFDRDSNYDGTPGRPWSMSPRRARLTFAILGIRGEEVVYDIAIVDGRRVFSWPDEQARTITKTARENTILTVRKRMTDPSQIKARVVNLSPDPEQPWIYHSYPILEVRVGDGDRGEEGFVELTVKGQRVPRGPQRHDHRVVVPVP